MSLELCRYLCMFFFFFKQKTAYELRISDWSSDVCSSDLPSRRSGRRSFRLSLSISATAGCVGFIYTSPARTARAMIRLFKHYVPNAVLLLGLLDIILLLAAAELGWVIRAHQIDLADRKSVVEGKSVSVRVDLGGSRIIQKKTNKV